MGQKAFTNIDHFQAIQNYCITEKCLPIPSLIVVNDECEIFQYLGVVM